MSIVNDALRKAEKEFKFRPQNKQPSETRPVKKHSATIPAVFIIAGLLAAWFFIPHRNAPETASENVSSVPNNAGSAIQSTLSSIEQKIPAKAMKSKDMAKLNGIVYGDEGKWAIVGDKIVKEGDNLLGGRIVSITRDLVRIEKKDGSELTLGLK